MATVTCFEDLNCWKKAREVCRFVGALIDQGRFKNNYRFINQVEGSSGSIMDNIAEGFERGSRLEFITFLGYAKGSCGELRSQLFRAVDRKLITLEEFETGKGLAMYTSALIQKLIAYLQQSSINGVRRK